jgi:paraquat-inducible protein A
VALTVLLTSVLSFNPGAFWGMTFRPKDERKDNGEGEARTEENGAAS